MMSFCRKVLVAFVTVLTSVGTFALPFAVQAQALQVNVAAFDSAKAGEVLVQYWDGRVENYDYDSTSAAALALRDWQHNPTVKHAQPNFVYYAAASSNDPLLTSQPHLEQIDAYTGWNIATDASDVVIAVIDSGVDITHEDLKDNIWLNEEETVNGIDDDENGYVDDIHGWDFVFDRNDVMPPAHRGVPENAIGVQHGTGVAGIIGAVGDNSQGIAGVAWKARIMPLRVLNEFGVGDSETVTKALQYAVDMAVDVMNLSLVGTSDDPLAIEALAKAKAQHTIVVAAAGNNGLNLNNEKTYPVCFDAGGAATVIGVGAVDAEFNRPSFSNFGDDCVDIVAPGVKIFTTRHVMPFFTIQDKYAALFSGTSFAAPQVTAVVALMKSLRPSLTADQALFLLQQGATRPDTNQVVASGFEYALNVSGTLALLDALPETIDITQPLPVPIVVKQPEFLAYSRGPNSGSAYIYQFPGPIMVTPTVFTETALQSGMRFTRESKTRLLVNAWKPNSKHVWRYNTLTAETTAMLVLGIDDEQTVGHVAVGNVDFDSDAELIIVSGPQSKPLVSVYTLAGQKKFGFQAYDAHITGGLDVAVLDVNGDDIAEIVTVPVSQGSGHVRVFDYTGLMLNEWNAYDARFQLGATISSADVDKDTLSELIVGPGEGGGPHVKVFEGNGTLAHEFFAGEVGESSGAIVDFVDLDQDQTYEYVVSYHIDHQSIIRIYSVSGVLQAEHGVFDPIYRGAIGVIWL